MNDKRLLLLSLIIAVLSVALLISGGVYLSTSATSSHDGGPTFTYKEVQAAPSLPGTGLDEGVPDDKNMKLIIADLVKRQVSAAKTAEKLKTQGKCEDYGGGIQLCGDVLKRYQQLGGVDGQLGRPLTNQVRNDDERGSRAVFEHGMIFDSPTTGATEVTGAHLIKYVFLGSENGPLGYPIASAEEQGDGTIQAFEGHTFITASKSSGVHYIGGRIYDHWQDNGGPTGEFGYPSSDVLDASAQLQGSGNRVSLFPNHKAIVSSSHTGTVKVVPWQDPAVTR